MTTGLTAEALYFWNELQKHSPQQAVKLLASPTSTATVTATATATATATKDAPVTITKSASTIEFLDNYQLEKINLRGIGPFEKDKLKPAPDLKGKITLPDSQTVDFSVTKPIARVPGDDEGTIYNWNNPFTKSYPNSEKPGADFIVQVGHTGRYKEGGVYHQLPAEGLRRALEENSRPFTSAEFKKTVEHFQKAKVTLNQGKVTANATIKAILRLSPKETDKLAEIYGTSGADRDILKFAGLNFPMDPKKEFCLLICGQELFPDEKPTPLVDFWLQTRYFVFFSLLS